MFTKFRDFFISKKSSRFLVNLIRNLRKKRIFYVHAEIFYTEYFSHYMQWKKCTFLKLFNFENSLLENYSYHIEIKKKMCLKFSIRKKYLTRKKCWGVNHGCIDPYTCHMKLLFGKMCILASYECFLMYVFLSSQIAVLFIRVPWLFTRQCEVVNVPNWLSNRI